MKTQIKNYSFNKTLKTVSFNDYVSIDLDSVLLLTNVTSNIIIYNFANPLLGGSVSGNTLYLNYDTSLMNDNDDLQIFYQDSLVPSTEIKQDALNLLIELLQDQIKNDGTIQRQLLQLLRPLSIITNGSYRLNIDVNNVGSLSGNIAQVTLVPTVSSVTNMVNIGGLNAFDLQFNSAHMAFADSIRRNVSF